AGACSLAAVGNEPCGGGEGGARSSLTVKIFPGRPGPVGAARGIFPDSAGLSAADADGASVGCSPSNESGESGLFMAAQTNSEEGPAIDVGSLHMVKGCPLSVVNS